MKYRVGLGETEVSEQELKNSGFNFKTVEPRKEIITSAKSVVGKPYKRGASVLRDAPDFFECSSLVAWAAVESGYAIPRVSIDQFVFAEKINKEDLVPGDLVFANTHEIIHTEGTYYSQVLDKEVHEEPIRYETLEYRPGTKVPHGVDHVGIYIGDNQLIHATSTKGCVIEEDMDESKSFSDHIVGYGRIVHDPKRFVVEIPDDRPDLRQKENLIAELKKIGI